MTMIARMMLQGAVAAALIAGAGMLYGAAAEQGPAPAPAAAAEATPPVDNGYLQPRPGSRLRGHDRDHDDDDDHDRHDRRRDHLHDGDHEERRR
jgi:hypothetical protein